MAATVITIAMTAIMVKHSKIQMLRKPYIFRRLGERFVARRNYAQALVAFCDVFASIIHEMHDTELPASRRLKVSFGWNRRNVFDAAATLNWRNRRIIRLDELCYAELQGHANDLFRHPNFLTAIGDPHRGAGTKDDPRQDAPACPIRFQAACAVTEIALGLIFLHELAHHVFSHIGTSVRSLHESAEDDQVISRQNARAFQIDEIQADRFAFGMAAALANNCKSLFDSQILDSEIKKAFLPELTITAQALIVGLLGGLDDDVEQRDHLRHPHPVVRMTCTLAFLAQDGPTQVDDAERTDSLYMLAANIFATFTSIDRVRDLFLENSGPLRERAVLLLSSTHPNASDRKQYSFKTGRFE